MMDRPPAINDNDSKNSSSETPPRTRTEIMTNQITPVMGFFNNYAYLPLLPFLHLFKPIAHVWNIAEDGLRAYFVSSHSNILSCIVNLLYFSFTMPLHLACRGEWPNLTCGSSRARFRPEFQNSVLKLTEKQ
jgi:hypothetical protein